MQARTLRKNQRVVHDLMKKMHCPTCGHTFDPEKTPSMPFCSLRCRQVDLGRWLEETHAIPTDSEAAAEADAAEQEEQ